jgi:hypothetical protein
MIVVRIGPSTYIITLIMYCTIRYITGTGTGTVPYLVMQFCTVPYGTVRYRNQLWYGTVHVRYMYNTNYNSTYGVVQ